jgi:hypothetical protein
VDPFAELPAQSTSEVLATILESLRVIQRVEPSPEERASFERCLARLPPRARWIHLSVMTARDPVELKLYGVFPRESVLPYLEAAGWAGDRDVVARMIDRYFHPDTTSDVLYVDLPVTGMHESARAGLGVVLAQQQLRRARDRDVGRRGFLQRLVDDRLCTHAQRAALVDWPGDELAALSAAPPSNGPLARVRRWFDIKVVHRPARPLLVKGYLGFVAQPVAAADGVTRAAGARPQSAAYRALPAHPETT